jgi:hypothetical protein
MKRLIILSTTILFLQQQGIAQFPQHIFPMEVIGSMYSDTLLNTRALMLKEGIRKVESWQTSPETTKTFASRIISLNEKGDINAVNICFPKNKDGNFTLCVQDTLLYDPAERLTGINTTDNKGNNYPRTNVEYINEREVNYLYAGGTNSDSSENHRFFNEKGQLVRVEQKYKGLPATHSSFFYDADGLLDSIRYDNPYQRTFVFNKSMQGKKKVVKMDNGSGRFKWIYNKSGQCETTEYIMNDPRTPGYKGPVKTTINYYYNPNGTLSRVTQQSDGTPKFTMNYSYSK